MIDVELHFRGVGSERKGLPTVPSVGSYIYGPGDERKLWRVDAVVLDGMANIYAVEVSALLTSELTAAWSAWCSPTADAAK